MKKGQAKALFRVQYLFQIIFARVECDEQYPLILLPQHLEDERGYLLLRSVSQLTDEEYKQVASINFIDDEPKTIENGKLLCLCLEKDELRFINPLRWVAVIDYLRSIGIIIPFTYIDDNGTPVTMSEADIINENWAKIKGV